MHNHQLVPTFHSVLQMGNIYLDSVIEAQGIVGVLMKRVRNWMEPGENLDKKWCVIILMVRISDT